MKPSPLLQIPTPTLLPNPPRFNASTQNKHHFLNLFTPTHLTKTTSLTALPSLAAELVASDNSRINIESILVSIDNFFNRYPFFVAGCTVIWLVVIPLTQEYLKKCKAISAIDAFRKLSELPNAELLDIRRKSSVNYISSPSLKILNKSAVWLEFAEGEEEEDERVFVREVLKRFSDPKNTVVCVLDNFDGNSMKVAELLFREGGFKEVYAIKGGVRGRDGWQAIQETFLPPSVHVYPRKKKKKLKKALTNDNDGQGAAAAEAFSSSSPNGEMSIEEKAVEGRPLTLSPYPRYPNFKPPSSPTPSKPKNS